MTHAELAQKIREAVYDRASEEGGAISKEQMEDTIGRVLAMALPVAPQPAWTYAAMEAAAVDALVYGSGAFVIDADGTCSKANLGPGGMNMSSTEVANRYEEWR